MKRALDDLRQNESGLSLVLVALALAVLFGAAGLAFDGGRMFAERRELRNGADAAALAIAEDCARSQFDAAYTCNQTVANATAGSYADANAKDGTAGVDSVVLDTLGASVRVVTAAEDEDGDPGLPMSFMRFVGIDRVNVRAPATAIWGVAQSGAVLPIVVEECEFEQYWAVHADAGSPIVLTFHQGTGASGGGQGQGQGNGNSGGEEVPCPWGPAGSDAPGGFGWLNTVNELCLALVNVHSQAAGNEGVSGQGPACNPTDIIDMLEADPEIGVPIYTRLTEEDAGGPNPSGTGNNLRYRIKGLAVLEVQYAHLSNRSGGQMYPGYVCPGGNDELCIVGRFKAGGIIPWGTPGSGGTNYGAYAVELTE